MLYIGHFSFIEHDEEGFNHGVFTAVVNADNIDNATVRLHSLLEREKSGSTLFDKYTFIFLEDIIEVKKMPEEGFIAHHTRYIGEPSEYVSQSTPGITEDMCESYQPYPQFEPNSDGRAEVDVIPFMTINP